MMDTYAKDNEHYEVITDKTVQRQELAAVQQRVHDALPTWVHKRDLTIGSEYLNLKEKWTGCDADGTRRLV